MRSVHIDVTYTSITVSYHRGPNADPITVLRVVGMRTQDFTRLERLRALVTDVSRTTIPVEEARVRFDAVVTAAHPYRRWLVTTASAVLAAAVAVLIGGGWLVTLVSFVSAVAIDRSTHFLYKLGIAPFFAQVIAAAIPTATATLLVVAATRGSGTAASIEPSLVVAAGIVLLLSGMSVVGAAEDALAGYYVTAGARTFEVGVLTLGIVIGVSLVLSIGNRLGYYVAVTSMTTLEPSRALQLGCSFVIAAAFAVSAYAVGRAVFMSAVLGTVAWWMYAALTGATLGAATSAAIAAAVVGLLAQAASGRLNMSAIAVTTGGIVPLLPGRAVYQGISQIVSDPETGFVTGMTTLAGAAGIGMGLAAGVSIGSYFGGLIGAWRFGGTLPRIAGQRRRDGDEPRASDARADVDGFAGSSDDTGALTPVRPPGGPT
ncbi:threonine/serine exporter family protein [Nostocoides japonicum]|uniref:threonine/serine ThrE exporter family protein n=1 Tax=Nostocoides japonicum TaxID=99481 RepID=UPI001F3946A7|nr:threonine/serine exporter family protein [Tetrasphaera japonica]